MKNISLKIIPAFILLSIFAVPACKNERKINNTSHSNTPMLHPTAEYPGSKGVEGGYIDDRDAAKHCEEKHGK